MKVCKMSSGVKVLRVASCAYLPAYVIRSMNAEITRLSCHRRVPVSVTPNTLKLSHTPAPLTTRHSRNTPQVRPAGERYALTPMDVHLVCGTFSTCPCSFRSGHRPRCQHGPGSGRGRDGRRRPRATRGRHRTRRPRSPPPPHAEHRAMALHPARGQHAERGSTPQGLPGSCYPPDTPAEASCRAFESRASPPIGRAGTIGRYLGDQSSAVGLPRWRDRPCRFHFPGFGSHRNTEIPTASAQHAKPYRDAPPWPLLLHGQAELSAAKSGTDPAASVRAPAETQELGRIRPTLPASRPSRTRHIRRLGVLAR